MIVSGIMMAWEYKFVILSFGTGHGDGDKYLTACETELNGEGAQGWEVVALLPNMGKNCFALMKRPKEIHEVKT